MKLFRKGIRQRRLTRMRELLREVMIENDSENELRQDGKSARVLVLVVEIIIITGLLTHPNVLESGEAFMLMGLIFPPFLLFGILLGMGTLLLIIGVIYLFRYFRVEASYQEFEMLYELASEELSVYKQEPLIPMSEYAERLQYYMEDLRLETEVKNDRLSK